MSKAIYFSKFFAPTAKEELLGSHLVAGKLLRKGGFVSQEAKGLYSILPLGLRVIKKINKIVVKNQDDIGACQIIMPILQDADLWVQSGRYATYGKEALKVYDRNNREMFFSPTNEEAITALCKKYCKSYKDLGKILYQIHWKFRDEIRPRYGLMRAREFFMKDAYSFDETEQKAILAYKREFLAQINTFNDLGLKVIPCVADASSIGGDFSYEFLLPCAEGESEIFIDEKILSCAMPARDYTEKYVQEVYEQFTQPFAKTQDVVCETELPKNVKKLKAIELGHVFYFQQKYSKSMNFSVLNKEGKLINPYMGSYGIGLSRIIPAIVQTHNDKHGIIWPDVVAPFDVTIVNMNVKNERLRSICQKLISLLEDLNIDILYDDRDISSGRKFYDADLIGIPKQIIVGNRYLNTEKLELKYRNTLEIKQLSLESILSIFDSGINDDKQSKV